MYRCEFYNHSELPLRKVGNLSSKTKIYLIFYINKTSGVRWTCKIVAFLVMKMVLPTHRVNEEKICSGHVQTAEILHDNMSL